MDVIEAERAFAAWAAEVLDMETDAEAFRGGVPEGTPYGVGAYLEGTTGGGYDVRPSVYRGRVLGKFADRDGAMRALSLLTKALPSYGIEKNGTIFRVLEPVGDPMVYRAEDGGRAKWFFSLSATVVVLTRGAQTKPDPWQE